MPIYESRGKQYNIPEDKVESFLSSRKDAKLVEQAPKQANNAQLTPRQSNIQKEQGSSTVESSVNQPNKPQNYGFDFQMPVIPDYASQIKEPKLQIGSGGNSFQDAMNRAMWNQQNTVEPIRGFGAGFEQGAKALVEGSKVAGANIANVATGSARDAERALGIIEKYGANSAEYDPGKAYRQDIQDRYKSDMEKYKSDMDKWYEKHPSILGRAKAMLPFFGDVPDEPKNPNILAPTIGDIGGIIGDRVDMRPYKLVQEALEQGDLEQAKNFLREKAGHKTWGDEVEANAIRELATLRPTEGFGAWVGNLTPQMIPNALAIASTLHPTTRPLAKPLAHGGMGILSLSSGGSAIAEARQYAEETGMDIPESTILNAGALSAAIEIVTEKIPLDRYLGGVSSKFGSKVAKDIVSNPAARSELNTFFTRAVKDIPGLKNITSQSAKKFMGDVAVEGASEFSAEALGAMVPMLYANKEDYPTLTEILENGWEGFKGGVFMGGVLGSGSHFTNNFAQNQRRKQQGSVTLMDTGNEIVEFLGQDKGIYTVLNNRGEVIDIPATDVIESHIVGWEEFREFAREQRKDNIKNSAFANLEASEKQIIRESFTLADRKFDTAFAGTRLVAIKEEILNASSEQQQEFIMDVATMEDLTDEQKTIAIDLIVRGNAYNSYRSLLDDVVDNASQDVAEYIEENSNPATNSIMTAKLAGHSKPVQIVDGKIVRNEDGTINEELSDKSITFMDSEGNRKPMSIRFVEEVTEEIGTEDAVSQAVEAVTAPIITQQQNEEVRTYDVGEQVRVQMGDMSLLGVISGIDGNGNYIFTEATTQQPLPIEPRQIVNEDNLTGIEPGMEVQYFDANGKIQVGVMNDLYSQRMQGNVFIGNDLVPVSSVIGVAQNTGAQSQQNTEQQISDSQGLEGKAEQNEQINTPLSEEQNTLSEIDAIVENAPKQKSGKIDYNALMENNPSDFATLWESRSGAESTKIQLQKVSDNIGNQIATEQKKLAKETDFNKIADIEDRVNELQARKQGIDDVVASRYTETQQQIQEEYTPQNRDNEHLWDVAENSNDVTEIVKAYDEGMEMAGEEALQPWQQELLGRRVNRDSFNMFGDRNYINSAIARSWFNRKDEESNNGSIDLIAKELGVDVQQIIEFIIDHPSNRVKRGNELTEALNARFKDVAKEITGREVGGIESNSAKLLLSTLEYAANNTPSEAETSFAQSDVVSNVPSPVVFFLNDYMRLDEIEDFAQFRNAVEEADALGYFMFPLTPNDKQIILNYIDNAERQTSELQGAREDVSSESVVENGEETINNESDETLEGVDEAQQEVLLPSEEEQQDDTVVSSPLSEKIEAAEAETNTNPTEAQKEAGNYKKGKVAVQGLDISIEQPKGSVRSGVDNEGKEWSVTMNNTYGYIRGTEGKDGDHIDIFLGNNPDSQVVYVVDQVNDKGVFDEHKVMFGFNSMAEARDAYLSNYSQGWQGMGEITGVDIESFRKWTESDSRKIKPFAEYADIKKQSSTTRFAPIKEDKFNDLIDRLKQTGLAKDVITDKETFDKKLSEVIDNDAVAKQMLSEMESIKQESIANNTFMLAPNGGKTNLSESQWLQVRTTNFKNWFGDWVNDPANASKVVDENGEPLVVYHGTNAEFTEFIRATNTPEYLGEGIYFSSERNVAEQYGGNMVETYLNLREPQEFIAGGKGFNSVADELIPYLKNLGKFDNDGLVIKATRDVPDGERRGVKSTVYVADDPTQIKSAISNNGEFSVDNADIRMQVYEDSQDFRDAHTAPSMDYETLEEANEDGGGVSLSEIVTEKQGIVPDDYFDTRMGSLNSGRKGFVGAIRYGYDTKAGNESINAIKSLREELKKGGDVKELFAHAYRAVPKDVSENKLVNRDWITLSKEYANNHGLARFGEGEYRIIEQDVPLNKIWWDGNDINEFGYDTTENTRFMRTSQGDVYGFVTLEGEVYLDSTRMNANTPIHEFGHLWNTFTKENNAELYNRGAELVQESEYWDAVNSNPTYANLSQEAKIDEAMAMAIGDKGESIVKEQGLKTKLKKWISDVWSWLGDKFNVSPKVLQDMTLDEFTNVAVAELLGGKPLISETIESEDGKSLIGIHNLTISNLLFSERMGGIANPSMAVVDVNKSAFDNFGEISLIAPPNLLSTKEGKNAGTFGADIYSPRYPRVEFILKEKDVKQFIKEINDYMDTKKFSRKEFDNIGMYDAGRVAYNIQEKFELDSYKYFPPIRAYYLEEVKGVDLPKDVKQDYLHKLLKEDPEFDQWVESKFYDLVKEEKLMLGYTPSGRRKYKDHTLENVSKAMKADGLRGGEGWGYGLGSIRANLTPKFTTLDQIRKAKNRLQNKEEFEKTRTQFREEYDYLVSNFKENIKGIYHSRDIADYSLIEGIAKEAEVDPEYKKRFDDFREALKYMPTEYFETKFERPVYLNEFDSATIPMDSPQEVRDILMKHGVDIVEYDPKEKGDRNRKIQSLPSNVRFNSVNDIAVTSNSTMTEEMRIDLDMRLKNKFFKIREAWEDKHLAIKEFLDVLRKNGTEVAEYNDYYLKATHISGKNDAQLDHYRNTLQRPLNSAISDIQKAGFEYRDVENYAILKHGLERNKWMREKEIQEYQAEHPDAKPDQLSRFIEKLPEDYAGVLAVEEEVKKTAEEFIQEFEDKAGEKLIGNLWSRVKDASQYSLTKQLEGGLLDKKSYDELTSRYEYYIPLRGHDDAVAEDRWDYTPVMGTYFVNPLVKANGRRTRAEKPFAFIAQQAQSSINSSNRNILNQTLLRLANQDKTGLMNVSRSWYELVGEQDGQPLWEQRQAEYSENPETYQRNIEKFEERMAKLQESGLAFQSGKKLDIGGLFIKKKQAEQHEVHIYQNGVDYTVYINANPKVAQAMNGTNVSETPKVVKPIAKMSRFMAANFTTRNPMFVMTNFSRDYLFASSILPVKENAKYAIQFQKNIPSAAGALQRYLRGKADMTQKQDQYLMEYILGGAKTGFSHIVEIQKMQKQLEKDIKKGDKRNALEKTLEVFSAANDFAENLSRLSVYMTSREQGRSQVRSVSDAKEVTVNFNRSGSGALGANVIRPMYLFVNAGLQSISNFAKVAVKNPSKTAALMSTYVMTGALLAPMLAQLLGGDDGRDEYMKLGEWERQNNFCIYTGKGFIKIPLPHELRVFHRLGDQIYHGVVGAKDWTEAFIDGMLGFSDLIPIDPAGAIDASWAELMPDAVKPFAQMEANKNFMGSRIYNEWANPNTPGYLKARTNRKGDYYAPAFLVKMTEGLDNLTGGDGVEQGLVSLNPDVIEHFARGYFGGLYNLGMQSVDVASKVGEFTKTGELKLKVRDTPLKTFFASSDDLHLSSSAVNSKYFKISDEVKDVKRKVKGYEDQIDEYMDKVKSGEMSATEFAKKQTEINAKIDKQDEDKALDVYSIIQEINDWQKDFKELNEEEQKEAERIISELKEEAVNLWEGK